jgi:WD40 repeat protein
MSKLLKLFTYLVAILALAGCGSVSKQVVSKGNEDKPTISSNIVPTITRSPTPQVTTKPSSTFTAEPITTPTIELGSLSIPICVGKGQVISPPPNFGITGTIVYQKELIHGLYTIGGTPLTQGQLADQLEEINVYGFSPDGMWLAYAPEEADSSTGIIFHTPKMILLSAAGERIEQVINIEGLEKELQERCVGCQGFEFFDSAGEWINNNLMYVHLGARSNEEGGPFSSLPKVFDPFTGDWQDQWFDNFPGVYTIMPTRLDIHHIKLSPDLSRVLYPTDKGGIILRDVAQGIELWSDKSFTKREGEKIEWSPDSKMVAVVNKFLPNEHRLLLITSDGEVTELVNAEYPQSGLHVTGLAWSPDSRYLAYTADLDDANLYLYDTQTKSYVYQCPLPGIIGGYLSLVWSPDNQWIAYSYKATGAMRLLNVQSGEVIELLDDAIPVGWSDKFPTEWP